MFCLVFCHVRVYSFFPYTKNILNNINVKYEIFSHIIIKVKVCHSMNMTVHTYMYSKSAVLCTESPGLHPLPHNTPPHPHCSLPCCYEGVR